MRYLYIIVLSFLACTSYGQSIIGQWETYDDKTNEKKSIIEIYEVEDSFYAKVIETFTEDKRDTCEKCTGAKKNAPIIGLVIIENIKKEGDKYGGGSTLDPESGETYKCILKLTDDDRLKVRGFIGVPMFGRTQYWIRTASKT